MKVMDVPLYSNFTRGATFHFIARVYEPVPGRKRNVFFRDEIVEAEFPDLYFMRWFSYENRKIQKVGRYRVFTWDGKSNTFSVPVLPHVYPSTHKPSGKFSQKAGKGSINSLGTVCDMYDNDLKMHPGELFFNTEFKYYAPDYPRHGDCVNWLTLEMMQFAFPMKYPVDHGLWVPEKAKEMTSAYPDFSEIKRNPT